MTIIRSEVRPGAYFDSAVLMRLQRALAGLPGVEDAGVVMATAANCELLEQSGLLTPAAKQANANDLLIVVRATDDDGAARALGEVDALLAQRTAGAVSEYRPKSLDTAVKQLPEAGWVLVSVPGRYAAGVARQALDLGRHVFLYSDNVSLEDEIALKQTALARGLLVMGPDCGTAIIGGVGLGFANRVARGNIGLVGASGTGLQAITSYIHALGGGVSHALGTGGRDLKQEVGAITARQALDVLARDPGTAVIVLVSKPPAPEVATMLLAAARATAKPVVVDFVGYPSPGSPMAGLFFANTLSESAQLAVQLAEMEGWRLWTPDPDFTTTGIYLRALFSGGTLAYEAMLSLQNLIAPLYSNVPITANQRLPDPLVSQAHTVLDLGEDLFTVGRLHPMMDNDLRIRRLRQEAADPQVGIIFLDVVLGEGAHPNPAGELAPVIAEVKRQRDLEVVAVVVGTDGDPQDMPAQVHQLTQAGTRLFRTINEAVDYIGRQLARAPAPVGPPVLLDRLEQQPFAAINVGLESFYASLQGQGAAAVQVDWRPPAGGNERMMAILAKMRK